MVKAPVGQKQISKSSLVVTDLLKLLTELTASLPFDLLTLLLLHGECIQVLRTGEIEPVQTTIHLDAVTQVGAKTVAHQPGAQLQQRAHRIEKPWVGAVAVAGLDPSSW